MNTDPCPSSATLELVMTDPESLAADRQEQVTRHLDHCASCQQRLETIARGSMDVPDQISGRRDSESALISALDRLKSHPPDVELAKTEGPFDPSSILEAPSRPDTIGTFGPYDITEILGRGNMGVVFSATDPALNRTVAVKVLHPALAVGADARERFAREARAAAGIQCDHVVTIHAVETQGSLPYLVMEQVVGQSLAQRLDDAGPLPVDEVCRIAIETARGLAAAHAQGLVHRDVKPANLLLDTSGRMHITDFGLARAVDDTSLTRPGVIAGTPEFMAPEQARGVGVDHRADLFSLGAVLYMALTGERPFRRDSSLAVLRAVCDDQPTPIQELNPRIPGWLISIVDRLLEKDPDRRFQSATDVVHAIESQSAQSRRTPLPTTTVIVAALSLSIVSMIGIWWVVSGGGGKPNPQPRAVPAALSGFRIAGADIVHPSLAEAVANAADGDTIEISVTGLINTPTIVIGQKALTIRAVDGAEPVLQYLDRSNETAGPIIDAERNLTLEGLVFQWFGPRLSRPVQIMDRCAIRVRNAELTAIGCRVVAGIGNPCIALDQSSAELYRCHLQGDDSFGVFWAPVGATRLTIDNTVISTRIAIGINDHEVPEDDLEPCFVTCDSSTIHSRNALQFMIDPLQDRWARRQRIDVTARKTVFDVESVLVYTTRMRMPAGRQPLWINRVRGMIDEMTTWHEAENIYRAPTSFIATATYTQLATPLVGTPQTLSEWFERWDLVNCGSCTGELTFAGRRDSPAFADHVMKRVVPIDGTPPATAGITP